MLCAPPARARARRYRGFFRVRKWDPPAHGSERLGGILWIPMTDRQTEDPWHGPSRHSRKEAFEVVGGEPRRQQRAKVPGPAIIGT